MLTKTFIALAALIVAAMAASQAMSMVAESPSPTLAMKLIPADGRAYSRAADLLVRQAIADSNGAMPDEIPGNVVELARRGFRLDPSAPEAVRTLALAAEAGGDKDKARELMRLTSRLSRRESVTNMWLSQDYLAHGQPEIALKYYDITLRTSPAAAQLLLPKMAAALQQDGMVELLGRLLHERPFWAADFWRQVIRVPQAAENAARLRSLTGHTGSPDDETIDKILLGQLVTQRRFTQATGLYQNLLGHTPERGGLVSDFRRSPTLPPFDWDLVSNGDLAASVDPRAGELYVSASPGAYGIIARRLVRADAGNYRLTVDFVGSLDARVALRARFRCALGGKGGGTFWSPPLAAGQQSALNLAAPESDCPYRWLELQLAAPATGGPSDIVIDRVALNRE